MKTMIEVGDVVEIQKGFQDRTELGEVIEVDGRRDPVEIGVKTATRANAFEYGNRVKRHWKPATKRRPYSPLKQPRQRDALVITEIVIEHAKTVIPTLKAFVRLTISDKLVLDGFTVHEKATGIEVQFPPGARLVIPGGKLLNAWRNDIVKAYIQSKENRS